MIKIILLILLLLFSGCTSDIQNEEVIDNDINICVASIPDNCTKYTNTSKVCGGNLT